MQKCPRCGADLPADAYLERMKPSEGRAPAYRLRHKKRNGRMCVAYVGPETLLVLPARAGELTKRAG